MPIVMQKALLGPFFLLDRYTLAMTSFTPISQADDSLGSFLVEPQSLLAAFTNLDGLLIDARSPEAYAAGHIPGAISVSTYDYFVPNTKPEGMRAFASQAAALYGAAGISLDTPLVVYDDDTGVRVARECWLLEYLGHRNVRLLHGGLNAWQQCGGPISTQAYSSSAQQFEIQHHGAGFVSADEITAELGHPKRVVIDVRDELEHDGLDHTACCERRGHLPGAVWIHCGFIGQNFWITVALNQEKQLGLCYRVVAFERMMKWCPTAIAEPALLIRIGRCVWLGMRRSEITSVRGTNGRLDLSCR